MLFINIKEDVNKWIDISFSLIGRFNTVSMTIPLNKSINSMQSLSKPQQVYCKNLHGCLKIYLQMQRT